MTLNLVNVTLSGKACGRDKNPITGDFPYKKQANRVFGGKDSSEFDKKGMSRHLTVKIMRIV